jgi:hypothetical protein
VEHKREGGEAVQWKVTFQGRVKIAHRIHPKWAKPILVIVNHRSQTKSSTETAFEGAHVNIDGILFCIAIDMIGVAVALLYTIFEIKNENADGTVINFIHKCQWCDEGFVSLANYQKHMETATAMRQRGKSCDDTKVDPTSIYHVQSFHVLTREDIKMLGQTKRFTRKLDILNHAHGPFTVQAQHMSQLTVKEYNSERTILRSWKTLWMKRAIIWIPSFF